MAISFPSSPSTGQSYTVGNITFVYNGTAWDSSLLGGGAVPLNGSNTSPVTGTISATTSGTATTILTVAIPTAGTWQITGVVAGALNNGQECTFALFDGSGTLVANTETKACYVGGGATYQGTGTGVWQVTTVGSANYTIRAWGPGAIAGCSVVSGSDGRTYSRYVQLLSTGTGGGGNYFDSNVVTLLASFGSNTITTTGNITAGNLIGQLANGTSNVSIPTSAGNVVTSVGGASILTVYSGGIKVAGSGVIQSPGGASSITLNNNGFAAPIANLTQALNVTGNANVTGNVLVSANVIINGNTIGNVAFLNKDGNASNVLYGNGVFSASYGNGNVTTLLSGFGSNTITTTGNITAGNFILSGQTLTATGLINSSYLLAQNNADQNSVTNGVAVAFQTTVASNGTLITKGSNTQFTLTAGQTYKLEAIIRRFGSSSSWGAFRFYDVTNSTYIGIEAFGEMVTSAAGVASTGVATAYVTPSSNTTYELRQTTVNTITVSNTYATIEITQVNPTVTLGAVTNIVATGNITAANINGNVALTGNITGTSPNVSLIAGGYTFTFDNTGNFTLPTNSDLVFGASTTLTSGAGTNGNITINPDGTGQLIITSITPAQFGNTVSISGNLTASSNIKASGTVYGFELSSTESVGDEGGQVNLAVPQTNTSLQNSVTVDVYQNKLRMFEGSTNAKGVFVDLNKAPNGVGGELLYKASGLVNAGVDVQLGNLKARIPTSGNRSLQVSTVTGTYTVYGSGVYSQNGISGSTIDAGSPRSITTTPTYLNGSYNFISGGATDTWTIMDVSNTIAWRISLIIGSGYNNNMISIERLV